MFIITRKFIKQKNQDVTEFFGKILENKKKTKWVEYMVLIHIFYILINFYSCTTLGYDIILIKMN